jgi:hypothetical protein
MTQQQLEQLLQKLQQQIAESPDPAPFLLKLQRRLESQLGTLKINPTSQVI